MYRSRSGKFVVHEERSEGHRPTGPNAEKWTTGWRSWIGDWSANQTWIATPAESRLHVAETLDELRGMVPPELFDQVAEAAEQPPIEDLDI